MKNVIALFITLAAFYGESNAQNAVFIDHGKKVLLVNEYGEPDNVQIFQTDNGRHLKTIDFHRFSSLNDRELHESMDTEKVYLLHKGMNHNLSLATIDVETFDMSMEDNHFLKNYVRDPEYKGDHLDFRYQFDKPAFVEKVRTMDDAKMISIDMVKVKENSGKYDAKRKAVIQLKHNVFETIEWEAELPIVTKSISELKAWVYLKESNELIYVMSGKKASQVVLFQCKRGSEPKLIATLPTSSSGAIFSHSRQQILVHGYLSLYYVDVNEGLKWTKNPEPDIFAISSMTQMGVTRIGKYTDRKRIYIGEKAMRFLVMDTGYMNEKSDPTKISYNLYSLENGELIKKVEIPAGYRLHDIDLDQGYMLLNGKNFIYQLVSIDNPEKVIQSFKIQIDK